MKAASYKPPYAMTPEITQLVAAIGETVGRFAATADVIITPRLRRENRIRSIQGSLAIEQNSLSLDQVTAVIQGRRVLGAPREIQEVRNAFAAYEALSSWSPTEMDDLLAAHRLLMERLVDEPGVFRRDRVGVFKDQQVVHVAPPAQRVPKLMGDLLNWLKTTPEHPLIAGCLFHYELEFIHPFADGNGRMGRLWQTLILCQWQPWFAFVPVESVVRERQEAYYEALRQADRQADATPFVVFMLETLRDTLHQARCRRSNRSSNRSSKIASPCPGDRRHDPLRGHEEVVARASAHFPGQLHPPRPELEAYRNDTAGRTAQPHPEVSVNAERAHFVGGAEKSMNTTTQQKILKRRMTL